MGRGGDALVVDAGRHRDDRRGGVRATAAARNRADV